MSRFYWEWNEGREILIFDRTRSSSRHVAICRDPDIAETIVNALNTSGA